MNIAHMNREQTKELVSDVLATIFTFTVLALIVYFCFTGAFALVNSFMDEPFTKVQGMVLWYVAGIACTLVWPLYYRKGMDGCWIGFFKTLPVMAISGPLALIFGFPL